MASRLSSFTHWVQAVAEDAPVQPLTEVVAVTQLANTPLLQEPLTQSSLVKVVSDRRTPKQLHSRELRLAAMQILAAVPPEWELLRGPILGLRVVDAQQFS